MESADGIGGARPRNKAKVSRHLQEHQESLAGLGEMGSMTTSIIPPHYHPLRGKWLRDLTAEDRRVFARWGYEGCLLADIPLAKLGGEARAKTAQRDSRGRFVSNSLK